MTDEIIEVSAVEENEPQTSDHPELRNEIAEIKKEQKKQRKLLTTILVFIIILTSVIVIYLMYKMTIGSIFGHIIGFVTGLFGS